MTDITMLEELEKIAAGDSGLSTLREFYEFVARERAKLRPKWYEREPFVKTMCRDKDNSVHLIVARDAGLMISSDNNYLSLTRITPLTKVELLAYAESAPEEI